MITNNFKTFIGKKRNAKTPMVFCENNKRLRKRAKSIKNLYNFSPLTNLKISSNAMIKNSINTLNKEKYWPV